MPRPAPILGAAQPIQHTDLLLFFARPEKRIYAITS